MPKTNDYKQIIFPLLRKCNAGKASIVIVTHPGDSPTDKLLNDIESRVNDEGLKLSRVQFSDLFPNPVKELVYLKEKDDVDVFSIICSPWSITKNGGGNVTALNIHRNTYAKKSLCSIFWIPAWRFSFFMKYASNFLDFRTRILEVGFDGSIISESEESPKFFVPPPPPESFYTKWDVHIEKLGELLNKNNRVAVLGNDFYKNEPSMVVCAYLNLFRDELIKDGGVFWIDDYEMDPEKKIMDLAERMHISPSHSINTGASRENGNSSVSIEDRVVKEIKEYLSDNPSTIIVLSDIKFPSMLYYEIGSGSNLLDLGGKLIITTLRKDIQRDIFPPSSVLSLSSQPPGFKIKNVLNPGKGFIAGISWSPDGKKLAILCYPDTIILWDAESERISELFIEGVRDTILCTAWSPDCELIAGGGLSQIYIWNTKTGNIVDILRGNFGHLTSLAWSPDGLFLASGSEDDTIRLWDMKNMEIILEIIYEIYDPIFHVRSLSWIHDSKTIASGSLDGIIRIWDTKTGNCKSILRGHSSINDILWSEKLQLLISGAEDRTIRLWNISEGKEVKILKGHKSAVTSISISPDNMYLASKSEDNTIRIWDLESGKTIASLNESVSQYWTPGIAFHPTKPILATLGKDDTIVRIWDLDFNKMLL